MLLIGSAWIVVSPVPSGPDEPAHYIRALAVAQGEFTGTPALISTQSPPPESTYIWNQTTRSFLLPASLAPGSMYACDAQDWSESAKCTSGPACARWAACLATPSTSGDVRLTTYEGVYEPTFYLIPGLFAHLANDSVNGLRAARLGQLLTAVALITAAGLLLWDERQSRFSLLGLLMAVTPMTLYMNTVVNPVGAEIVASLAFAATLLRIWRDGTGTSKLTWIAAGAFGCLCCIGRIEGPLWAAVAAASLVGLLGPREALATLRAGGRWAAFAVAAVVAGALLDEAWWHLVVSVPASLPGYGALDGLSKVTTVAGALVGLLEGQISGFGWDPGWISAGPFVSLAWGFMVTSLVTLALLVGRRRERIVIALLLCFDIAYTVGDGAVSSVVLGWGSTGVVGRLLLPLSVIPILVAGEVLCRNHERLRELVPQRLSLVLAVPAALCQGIALWMAARAYAVGLDGQLFFLRHSQWRPPFGWSPWLVITTLGCLAIVGAGWLQVGGPTDGAVAVPLVVDTP